MPPKSFQQAMIGEATLVQRRRPWAAELRLRVGNRRIWVIFAIAVLYFLTRWAFSA